MSNSTNKNIFQRFITWYNGQTEYSIGEQIGSHADNRTRSVKLPPIPLKFNPPLLARILNPIGRFLFNHWKWFIGTLIAFGIFVFMILGYIYK